jgi:hypothetical protein
MSNVTNTATTLTMFLLAALIAALPACASPTGGTDSPPAPEPSSARAISAPTSSSAAARSNASALAAAAQPTSPAETSDAAAPIPGDPDASAGAPASASAMAAPSKEPEAPFAPDNKIKPPPTSEELQTRAKALFEAIVKDDPPLGDPFWFPKEPFTPLKDVKNPEKYWKNLHAAYAADIHKVHKKRKSWEGAKFKSFEVGSTPKWVPPGDEANKIGYYRSFRGKLRYELDGETYSIEVHTVISWQARWYITHLLKFKK